MEHAGETRVGTPGLTGDGPRRGLGRRPRATQDAEVGAAPGADLGGRGRDPGRPTPFVLDGAKAPHAAGARVRGGDAVVQRRPVPETRNRKAQIPEEHGPELQRRPSEAGHATARASLGATARWRDRLNAAAASRREGPEEPRTVVRPGGPGALRRAPATTHPIGGAASVTRRATARVTRWRDGDRRRRRCGAGGRRAEGKSRRGRRVAGGGPRSSRLRRPWSASGRLGSGVTSRENGPRNRPSFQPGEGHSPSQARIGVYDCLHVALAEREGCELLTADVRLVRAPRPMYPSIVPLSSLP